MQVDPSAINATVTGAIRHAARMTGTDFRYLVATAQIESNFNPKARAGTSSARGLFQFIEQTWLHTLKEQGPALGYGPYASAVARLPSGKYVVTEPGLHGAIMNLRSDPTANAVMAGAFTRANSARLAGTLGRAPAEGELYIAHFLGPTGASRLIRLAQSRPTASAAAAFPGAAQANRAIFYDRQGHARSASEVYRALVGRYQVARAAPAAPTVAAMPVDANEMPLRWPAVAAKDAAPRRRAIALDAVAKADTYQAVARPTSPAVRARETGPIFHGLFRTAGAHEPVAPVVSALWTAPTQAPPPKSAAAQRAPADPASSALDLFQEQPPDARALFRSRG